MSTLKNKNVKKARHKFFFSQKTIYNQFIILFMISFPSAQTWYSIEPRATEKDLASIYFCDSLNGWAVGFDGDIIHSSDGGFTWAPQTSGVTDTLYDVYFSDISHGWAVGRNGSVLQTLDGGTTWKKHLKRTNHELLKVRTSGDTVIIVSQFKLLFKSIDGGMTWTDLSTGFLDDVYCVEFIGLKNILVGTLQGVIKSTDEGANWHKIDTSLLELKTLIRNTYFFNLDTGYVYSDYGIYFTSDGGQTWDTLVDPKNALNFWQYYYGLTFIDHQKGYMVACEGAPTRLLKTLDGCHTWSIDSSYAAVNVFSPTLYFDKWHNGWCVGDYGSIYTTKSRANNRIKNDLLSSGLYVPHAVQTINSYALIPLLKNTDHIFIYDCVGKLVTSNVVSSQYCGKETFPLNTKQMSHGVYFLALTHNETFQKTYTLIKR